MALIKSTKASAISNIILFIVIFLIVLLHLGYLRCLHEQLRLKLVLLHLSQLRELAHYLGVVFEAASTDDLPRLSVPLSLGHLIVLFSHVHVPCGISSVLLAAIVKTRELLLKFLGASPHMLLPLVLLARGGAPHLNVLNQVVH